VHRAGDVDDEDELARHDQRLRDPARGSTTSRNVPPSPSRWSSSPASIRAPRSE